VLCVHNQKEVKQTESVNNKLPSQSASLALNSSCNKDKMTWNWQTELQPKPRQPLHSCTKCK